MITKTDLRQFFSKCFLQGVSFTDLARALLDAKDRAGDKSFRAQLPALLVRLSFYEELPADVITRLVPLFAAYSKEPKILRSLFYLCTIHVSRGAAGTPTLLDPSTLSTSGRPDAASLQAIFIEGQRLLQAPDTDPAVRRAAAFLLAGAGRSNDVARKETLAAMERAVTAADALASAEGLSSKGKSTGMTASSSSSSSATNWELQHTVFAAVRMSDAAAISTELGRGSFQGIGSPDPVGARHALAIIAELALREPALVMHELSSPLTVAVDFYEAVGPAPSKIPGTGINLEDSFARLHLARACAAVLHSDQGASDVARGGGPFWRMLCMLATRDPSDLVRFGALEALTGAVVAPSATTLSRLRLSEKTSVREGTVLQQRRARAWRLLVAQAASPVSIPGVTARPTSAARTSSGNGASSSSSSPSSSTAAAPAAPAVPTMKLIDVIGRLLLLALSKVESGARFCVAASVASSLAESCLASQSSGNTRHITSPDVERVITILSGELGAVIESPLRPAQRCGCIEALLYLQAAGYNTNLTPAKLASVGARGGGGGAGDGVQDALLTAVLKCSKARPTEAGLFLSFASGVVGISPSGINLKKVTELWDAAVASGKEGTAAAFSATLEALKSAPPPSTRPRSGAGSSDVVRAAREESGWNGVVATAAWWLGEHANELCEEYSGKKVLPIVVVGSSSTSNGKQISDDATLENDGGGGGDYVDRLNNNSEDGDDDDAAMTKNDDGDGLQQHQQRSSSSSHRVADFEAVLCRQGQRNPALSRVISALHDTALTATWQLRAAAARALSKIAVRSGEPFRLQCYGILTACAVSGGAAHDALGLQGIVTPALSLLDKIYATQIVLDSLRKEHGEDVESWPDEIVSSLARRAGELRLVAERTVCSVPRERYALLGPLAAEVLSFADEGDGPAYASFLVSEVEKSEAAAAKKKKSSAGDTTGLNIAATKNKEIEDILSFGADSESSSTFFKSFPPQQDTAAAATSSSPSAMGGSNSKRSPRDDRDAQIENLMSGGGGESDPWAFSTADSNYNAFAETPSTSAASPRGYQDKQQQQSPLSTRGGGGESDPFAEWNISSTGAGGGGATGSGSINGGGGGDAVGSSRVLGSGVMVHTFIADSSNHEELSIFEGDHVDVLEENDGWMLVRDPSGSQGLVPTAYVKIERLSGAAATQGGGGSLGGGGGDVWDTFAKNSSIAVISTDSPMSQQRGGSHARGGKKKPELINPIFCFI